MIRGRMPAELVGRAKAITGISSDSKLLEAALANLALEDQYGEWLHANRGSIASEINLMSLIDVGRPSRGKGTQVTTRLVPRSRNLQPFLSANQPWPPLLLDSTVYIDQLQGRFPPAFDVKLRAANVGIAPSRNANSRPSPGCSSRSIQERRRS